MPDQERDPNLDLGFGAVVSRESRGRLLNRDGTFNARRDGLGLWRSLSAYHFLLTLSWPRFLAAVTGLYVVINALFAVAYLACGDQALSGMASEGWPHRFSSAFFFSVDTLATIGYGNIVPMTLAANLLVTFEALIGLLGFALITGIFFARFSRPTVQIVFSKSAIIAPYRDRTAFMFRIVNQRTNEIVELAAKVMLTKRRDGATGGERDYFPLKLERERVVFFPLSWTVVHPIDETSPLWGLGPDDLVRADAEFLILLNGFDETFSQNVHTRSSYLAEEVVWGARYRNMFRPPRPDGKVTVDIRKLDEIDRVQL
jgi:inward rectifier potassium channel